MVSPVFVQGGGLVGSHLPVKRVCEHCGGEIVVRAGQLWVHRDDGRAVCQVTFASPA